MRSIQNQLPNPRHVELHRIIVNAGPVKAWEAARHFDGASIPWVKMLFALRTLPDRLHGRTGAEEDHRLGVDQITESGNGFMIVDEIPGREVVVASVGQFWHLTIPFATVAPADFAGFNTPGWGKLAWAIAVEPYESGSVITFELRTTATDEDSWRRLTRYFHVIGPMSHLIRSSVMAHLEAELGEMRRPSDSLRTLPGDERLPNASYALTHSIDIEAPAELVWRYLMQLGCDRAGWYSIDAFDHGGMPSIERHVPEWGTRAPGDKLAATPAQDGFFDVYDVQENRAFVIGGHTERFGGPTNMTWAFVLEPLGEDATHLTSRVRLEARPRWAEWLQGTVLAPVAHTLMQHVQLRNLKRLAERDALARGHAHSHDGA